jgi:hypothetical protein
VVIPERYQRAAVGTPRLPAEPFERRQPSAMRSGE